jgi:branched-subunit amino acid aminotransferase/4-amino-4-deoxychorismate lyase
MNELNHGLKDEMKIPLFISIHDEKYGSEYNSKIKKGTYEFQKRALAEQSKQFDERLIKNENNKLIEGLFSNLFWIKKNTVFCVIEDTCILEGLMQIRVRKLCQILGIKIVQTEGLPLKEYQHAEAIFLTNMVRGLRCVKKLNGQNYKRHPIIKKIQENIISGLED